MTLAHAVFYETGHYHAALTLRTPNPRLAPDIHVYATPGPERQAFVTLVESFNTRADNPTHWRLHLVWSKNSCGFTFVVFEEASKPFTTLHRACMFCVLADSRKEQDIPFPLMISLVMVMHQVFIEGATQRRFST
jgi:hypothetical protein